MGTLASLDLCQRPLNLITMSKDKKRYRYQHGVQTPITDLISPKSNDKDLPVEPQPTAGLTYNPFTSLNLKPNNTHAKMDTKH